MLDTHPENKEMLQRKIDEAKELIVMEAVKKYGTSYN